MYLKICDSHVIVPLGKAGHVTQVKMADSEMCVR